MRRRRGRLAEEADVLGSRPLLLLESESRRSDASGCGVDHHRQVDVVELAELDQLRLAARNSSLPCSRRPAGTPARRTPRPAPRSAPPSRPARRARRERIRPIAAPSIVASWPLWPQAWAAAGVGQRVGCSRTTRPSSSPSSPSRGPGRTALDDRLDAGDRQAFARLQAEIRAGDRQPGPAVRNSLKPSSAWSKISSPKSNSSCVGTVDLGAGGALELLAGRHGGVLSVGWHHLAPMIRGRVSRLMLDARRRSAGRSRLRCVDRSSGVPSRRNRLALAIASWSALQSLSAGWMRFGRDPNSSGRLDEPPHGRQRLTGLPALIRGCSSPGVAGGDAGGGAGPVRGDRWAERLWEEQPAPDGERAAAARRAAVF